MIYLLTAVGLSPGGSTHLHTNNTSNNTNNNRTTQITTNVEECGPCPVFAIFTLTFALQLRKKHGKTSVRLRKTSVRVQYTYYQKHPHITKPSQTHTLQNPLIHPSVRFWIYQSRDDGPMSSVMWRHIYIVLRFVFIICCYFYWFNVLHVFSFLNFKALRPIYRTGVQLPSRCCTLYILFQQI
jgi:hypothetical protein